MDGEQKPFDALVRCCNRANSDFAWSVVFVPAVFKTGVSSQANGSAYCEIGNTKVYCAV